MRMRIFTVLFLVSFVLMACGTHRGPADDREDLYNTVKEYNDLVSLKDFDKAKHFVADFTRKEFEASTRAAGPVKIAGYRILSREFSTMTGKETVTVEFEYSISPSTQKRTIIDNQSWSFLYKKEEGKKRWRLATPLPEFK
jgi:hypothetical protein